MHPSNFHKSFETLPDDVKKRYFEKIAVINNEDPYCVRTNGKDIPASVNTGHVVDYLLHHKSPFSEMLAGSSKSLEAYKKFEAGYVSSVEGCEINDYFIIRGKVKPCVRLCIQINVVTHIPIFRFRSPCGYLKHHIVHG